jgi:hypothetical protein
MKISRLSSGGIITNYFCSSECKHCLYNSSFKHPKNYIDEDFAFEISKKILSLGCGTVHIGGGEPFLRFDKLLKVLKSIKKAGLEIEYIETNSSWFKDEKQAEKYLLEIKNLGVSTLLVSISPFHNEFIPFYKVEGVLKVSKKIGISCFEWLPTFKREILSFDRTKTHSLKEYSDRFGEEYIKNLYFRYYIRSGGRVGETFRKYFEKKSAEHIVKSSGPCFEIAEVTHFHIDLYGNYVPGLCAGFSINYKDLGKSLENYELITAVYEKGISALYDIAKKHGFSTSRPYMDKCDLCNDIRKFLYENGLFRNELLPKEYYEG